METKLCEALEANKRWKSQYSRLEEDSCARISYLEGIIKQLQSKERSRKEAMSSRDNDDDKDSVIAGLKEKLRVATKAKESRDRQFDVVAAKLDFVEKQMTEKTRETSRKQRKTIEALQKELNETKAERDDLLAIREQVNIYKQDFDDERQDRERLEDEKRALEETLASLRRQIGQLKATASIPHTEVGFLVTPDILAEQKRVEKWYAEQKRQTHRLSDLLPRSDGTSLPVEGNSADGGIDFIDNEHTSA